MSCPPTPPEPVVVRPPAPIKVWDLSLRLFHWTFALAVTGGIATGEVGGDWIEWHGRLGLLILALLAFRLAWGVVGPTTARFSQFVRGPAVVHAYLRGQWQGVGHNPLGALAVLALLGVTASQALLGLFANDDIAYQGPLADLVSEASSNFATTWHTRVAYALFALLALHMLAIAFYRLVKRQDLIGPMLTGWTRPAVAAVVAFTGETAVRSPATVTAGATLPSANPAENPSPTPSHRTFS